MNLDEKFWLAVCFVFFVIFAYKPIKKAILGMIDRRINMIRTELKNAKVMRLEAEAGLEEAKLRLERIVEEREGLLQRTKADIAKISKESERELEMMMKLRERDAESRLEQLKENATKDLSNIFTKAAKNLVEKYLNEQKSKLLSDEVLASHLLKK